VPVISAIFSKIASTNGREAGRRLVEEHRGVGHQRAGHRDHLPLATAHRPGRLPPALAKPGKELVHLAHPPAGRPPVERPHLEVLIHRERLEDVVELRHVAHPATRDQVRPHTREVLAPQEDATLSRGEQPEDGLDHGRLPRAVRPDHGDDLAILHRQVNAGEDVHLWDVSRDQTLDCEDHPVRLFRGHPPPLPAGAESTATSPR
jgi:hypothetical protein